MKSIESPIETAIPVTLASSEALEADIRTFEAAWLKGEYTTVRDTGETLMGLGVLDGRVVTWYLYACLATEGARSLTAVLHSLARFLGRDDLPDLGSATGCTQMAKGMDLMFRKITKRLSRKAKGEKGSLNARALGLTCEDALRAREQLEALESLAREKLPGEPLGDLQELKTWLEELHHALETEAAEAEARALDAQKIADAQKNVSDTDATDTLSRCPDPVDHGAQSRLHLPVSPMLQDLLDHLDLFERLTREERYRLAAVVMESIDERLASFDPRDYFPSLFRDFSQLRASRMEAFAEAESYQGTREWDRLRECLRVNPEAFLDLDS
ncbi:type VI secretion system protein IglI family protein [Desulfoluna spongiiphila]|uniref:type VI secretion system protein IglI family protein n=1 Tax=Desulfoluna spongiiphila TaxID=419481 RepID=UPI001256D05B|nr:type VI secretion system protein IglI family protein [Desulfoluna spongiiphila]VVS95574.1 hypothetical protein DBB_51510 [Desulfoluna spongiiphila]